MKNKSEQFELNLGIQPKLTSKQLDNFTFDLMDCLKSPIITYPSLWADTLPKDVVSKVSMERLIALITRQQKATLSEVILYLSTASLEMPLSYEWAEIYTWCGLQFVKKYRNEDTIKQMEEIAPSELNSYLQDKLDSLQTWIYEKRRKALKSSLKK
ncbi:hypothetical protein [Winogradskyella sp. 4-2091]|uniref:hypothetical protein n=1 Tax=Winogradskyella sp. 4-2091 TaxID=3381659 RepID=UPI003891D900